LSCRPCPDRELINFPPLNRAESARDLPQIPRTGYGLADLAVDSFIETRDKAASKTFRAKKKLDHALEAALPGIYLPLYTMVTFTGMPYAKAAKRAQIQDALVYVSLFVIAAILVAAMLWLVTT